MQCRVNRTHSRAKLCALAVGLTAEHVMDPMYQASVVHAPMLEGPGGHCGPYVSAEPKAAQLVLQGVKDAAPWWTDTETTDVTIVHMPPVPGLEGGQRRVLVLVPTQATWEQTVATQATAQHVDMPDSGNKSSTSGVRGFVRETLRRALGSNVVTLPKRWTA
jgi:hypothetical protein